MRSAALALFASTLLLASGCRRDDITVQRVPKESGMPSSLPAPAATRSGIRWIAPAGWTEQPASGMRAASFRVPAGEEFIEVSVVPLGGEAGGELANVNRWRGQL